ncbi:MAG: esterase-like activity of phytase family protein [Gammaproteobacteria bacterium]|nr:esterase-like activity of phytase family protein [Gammaproteobacteria bacterium]
MKKIFTALPLAVAICGAALGAQADQRYLQRVSVFPVCENIERNCDTDTETSAEIVVPSRDGKVLVYTDSQQEQIGFVDISKVRNPKGMGTIPLAGEPTSVDIWGRYAFVAVNTSSGDVIPGSEDANADLKFTRAMSGELVVFDMHSGDQLLTIPLSGQPDSVAVSPDGQYVAIAIESERDEEICVGGLANAQPVPEDDDAAAEACEDGGGGVGIPGQGPAGGLDVVKLEGDPKTWHVRIRRNNKYPDADIPLYSHSTVSMVGIADKFPADPEPEYVDINKKNIAVVTLQENNHIALVNLEKGKVFNHFSMGDVDLSRIDTKEEDIPLISLTDEQFARPREADGVTWINRAQFATADEGDMDGGSRGFSIYNRLGVLDYSYGNELDHLAVRFGHYPDDRSKNKGNEPENVDFLEFRGNAQLLAVASERSSVLFIYDVRNPSNPQFLQVLPAGVAPEGVKAIPRRNLLVAASEADSRDDKHRSVINIYKYGYKNPIYPTIESANRADGTPIPWGALSGLAAASNDVAYTIHDSFYQQSRIFELDLSAQPARIVSEIVLRDSAGLLAGLDLPAGPDDEAFDSDDLAALINADKSVNLDPEGIALASDGGFWIASEGAGSVPAYESGRPISTANLVLKTDAEGNITRVITLPGEINAQQRRFGFEGVAEHDGKLYVAMQRPWTELGDSKDVDHARIAVYDLGAATWSFLFYPLDPRESQNGGWVGLSEITALGNGEFMVVERDNQAGPDAAIKRLYTFDTTGLEDGAVVTKTLLEDLMDDLQAPGGLVLEKIEGAAVLPDGDVLIVNDNDGVDASNGETQLINLGKLL